MTNHLKIQRNNVKEIIIDDERYKIGDLFNSQSWRRGSNFIIGFHTLVANTSPVEVPEEIHIEKGARSTRNVSILRKNSLINKFFEKQDTLPIQEQNSEYSLDDSSNDTRSCKV